MLDCLVLVRKTLRLSKTSFGLLLLMYTSEFNLCTIMMSHLLYSSYTFTTFLSTHVLHDGNVCTSLYKSIFCDSTMHCFVIISLHSKDLFLLTVISLLLQYILYYV